MLECSEAEGAVAELHADSKRTGRVCSGDWACQRTVLHQISLAENPYASPSVSNLGATHPGGEISSQVVDMLSRTKGWVRFLGVLGFIATAFILLASVAIFATGGAGEFGEMGAAIGAGYLVMGVVYFYASFKLNQYASKIGAFVLQPTSATLSTALDAQRGFWKFAGVLTIIFMVIYLLAIVGVVIFTMNQVS
jgi:hypothetical protein